ncbi:blue light sensor protein [Tamilnaduibacter salinus]|uniref:Blue light sensor protein n=1 Tax=Tamilnaduibacter salinus TaxID=1484056 RepID=A0A2A2I2W5_9GAMM|nr:BLUF domain-containing protein [Tamilnaduibacter salinus]PAV25922.1 blue light sensor protein [Tamilnaduibacter salinus]
MSLVRLAYASRAAFEERPASMGVEPTVARILMASRRNNPKQDIVGGLYYGDGCFFQYLEGPASAVRQLYQTIQSDPRHTDVVTLLEEPLEAYTFSAWSMKYVPTDDAVGSLLSEWNMTRFDPFEFDDLLTDAMIRLIGQEANQEALPASGAERSRAPAMAEGRWERNVLLMVAGVLIAGFVVSGVILL